EKFKLGNGIFRYGADRSEAADKDPVGIFHAVHICKKNFDCRGTACEIPGTGFFVIDGICRGTNVPAKPMDICFGKCDCGHAVPYKMIKLPGHNENPGS